MPSTRSSAATKCISEVPGLEKQTSTPPPTRVRTRLSAPFIPPPKFPMLLMPAPQSRDAGSRHRSFAEQFVCCVGHRVRRILGAVLAEPFDLGGDLAEIHHRAGGLIGVIAVEPD